MSQVSFTLACGFPGGGMGLAEAVPHMDGVEPELVSAAETPQLCIDVSILSNEPWLQEKLGTHCCKISVG